MKRLIRVTSSALGVPTRLRVYVYDDANQMRRDAAAFAGDLANLDPRVRGVTQAWTDDTGRAGVVLVRLCREYLDTEVIVHELHHASTALFGATLPDDVARGEVLTHTNEPWAHLHGQLVARLAARLDALGYLVKMGRSAA